MPEYISCLFLFIAVSALLDDRRILFTSLALSANWAVNTVTVSVTGMGDPWWAFLPIDYMTALILLMACDGICRWVCAVAVIYAFQCIGHGVYGASFHDAWARYYYYYALSYSAWAQLVVVGGWIIANITSRTAWYIGRSPLTYFGFRRTKKREGE